MVWYFRITQWRWCLLREKISSLQAVHLCSAKQWPKQQDGFRAGWSAYVGGITETQGLKAKLF